MDRYAMINLARHHSANIEIRVAWVALKLCFARALRLANQTHHTLCHMTTKVPVSLLFLILIAGCAHRPAGIPNDAIFVGRETGRLAFAASENGIVFIYNADKKKVIFSTPVHLNDKVIAFPEKNQILLNGRVISETSMSPKDVHHLYFLKG
jgi:hypothetical protein